MIEPHNIAPKRMVGFVVCQKCGLMYLNNELTRAAIKYGCNHEDHPEYQKIRKKLKEKWYI